MIPRPPCRVVVAVLSLLLAGWASFLPAQVRKPIASVTRQIQPAVVMRQASARAAAVGRTALAEAMPLYAGDVVETSTGGRAQVTLKNGSIVNVGAQTRVRLPDNEVRPRFQLIRGVMRVQLVPAKPGIQFEVLSETALCRVSEGELLVDARSTVATFVLNLGKSPVEVQGERGKVTVQPGQGIWSDKGYSEKPGADDLKKLLADANAGLF